MAASSNDWPVHQLWPLSESKKSTELDVVLFHGLQLTENDNRYAWKGTWTQRGHDDICWPEQWLPTDLRVPVRIFSVSYNAHVVTSPHGHVSEIADALFQALIIPRYEWHHPIVLIGHSFGGLVLKSLVVKLRRRLANENATDPWSKATYQCAKLFLSNVRGVAFYAVPHAGSTKFAEYVKELLRCNNRRHHGIMDNIQPWQQDMEQLSVDFDGIVKENEISIYAFCEGKPMDLGILVDFSSTQRLAGTNFYMVEDANHMEVCKPPSKDHPSYNLLLQFIIICWKVARECDQPLQEVDDLPQSTFGLESYVERVETLVTSEGSDAAPQYVGVWGMGGVGKTLLLQRLYGSLKVCGCFQGAMFIWLTVGQTPDIMALYRTLSKKLHLDPEWHVNPEDYKHYLLTWFTQKRVFLVLDDVWKDKAFDSLDLAKGKGSVTLLSIRNHSLLDRPTPHITQVHMTPLSKEDSWSLFCMHAFGAPSNVPRDLQALAQCMAEECQGLPLALKVIGRAMFRKASCEWEALLRKLRESRLQEGNVEEQLYERLKLGYDLLSEDDSRLKDCFLYFAAFPENSRIDFHEILRHCVGEGLVPGNGADDPRADAFSLLKKLWERSFIESDEWYVLDEGFVLDEEDFLTFKIHDVMRDLAFYILEYDGGTPPAKQLCLYGAGQNLQEIPQEWKAEPFTPQQLWPPTKGMYPITKATVTIILFHGISDAMDAWKTTWTNNSDVFWPQEWLPEDLGKERVRVLSMSYDSTATRWVKNQGNTERVQDIGSELLESLVTTKEWQLDVDQNIVLIGHSFGGLVIKSLVVKAHRAAQRLPANRLDSSKKEMCTNFLANIEGIFFYGVPHTGALIANYVKNLNKVFPLQLAGIMKNLVPFQNDMEQLSVDFENAIDPERVMLYAFAEKLDYKKVLVVPWASAIQLTGHNNVTLHANHVEICKPHSRQSPGYAMLLERIRLIRERDLI